jgi:hypothetical protein
LKVAPTDTGCCIRVEGRGTMHESQAAKEIARQTLENDDRAVVVFDLSACEYLDSTFLGVLMGLLRAYGRVTPPRYYVAADAARRKRLLGPCRIDTMIPSMDAAPAPRGPWATVSTPETDPRRTAEHMLECHRALAEVDSPARPAFLRLVNLLEKELQGGASDARA